MKTGRVCPGFPKTTTRFDAKYLNNSKFLCIYLPRKQIFNIFLKVSYYGFLERIRIGLWFIQNMFVTFFFSQNNSWIMRFYSGLFCLFGVSFRACCHFKSTSVAVGSAPNSAFTLACANRFAIIQLYNLRKALVQPYAQPTRMQRVVSGW